MPLQRNGINTWCWARSILCLRPKTEQILCDRPKAVLQAPARCARANATESPDGIKANRGLVLPGHLLANESTRATELQSPDCAPLCPDSGATVG